MDNLFYSNGAIYAKLTEELREYFYENGQKKTIESYRNGRLHGEVELYWPNGVRKRKCFFVDGVRKGLDQIWDDRGNLIDEDRYE